MFASKLMEADAEATETQVWLDFASDCGYLGTDRHQTLVRGYELVGRMLGGMITQAAKLIPSLAIVAYCLWPIAY